MKILLVAGRYPWPARRGDQMRSDQLLRFLLREHQPLLVAPEAPPGAPAPPAGLRVEAYRPRRRVLATGLVRALLEGFPLQAGLYYQPELARLLRHHAQRVDLVILQLARQGLHRADLGETPTVVDLIDSLSLNFQHRARLDTPLWRLFLRWEARRLAAAERKLVAESRESWLVCARDREFLAGLEPSLEAKLRVVPIAVPPAERPAPPVEQRVRGERLVFTGNLGYFVNSDAIRWFLRRVWPVLVVRRPTLRLTVAGSRPPRSVRRAVAAAPRAELIDSPANLRAILASASAALAPMRSGSGVPVKVLEAWAEGVPVVASPWAGAGTTGRGERDFLLADQPEEWVEGIGSLLDDPALASRLVEAGQERLRQDYSAASVSRALGERLTDLSVE